MRRHSHRNEIAYKKVEDVRYVLQTVTGINEDEIDVCMFTGTSSEWMSINNEFSRVRRTVESVESFIERGPEVRFEVQSGDLPYLEKPDVEKYGEMEFRKIETGDWYILNFDSNGYYGHGESIKAGYDAEYYEHDALKGLAWCEPRKVGFELWWGENRDVVIDTHIYNIAKQAYNAGKESK